MSKEFIIHSTRIRENCFNLQASLIQDEIEKKGSFWNKVENASGEPYSLPGKGGTEFFIPIHADWFPKPNMFNDDRQAETSIRGSKDFGASKASYPG